MHLETRQPSKAGVDLAGKNLSVIYLEDGRAVQDGFNAYMAEGFASYLEKYSADTQFIVITHRKGTMEVANSVYGVTMQEYGVSKLISMKIK